MMSQHQHQHQHQQQSNTGTTSSPAIPNPERYLPDGSRLFIVTSGKQVPEYILQSVFSSFGGLEYVRMAKDKNYGYVKVRYCYYFVVPIHIDHLLIYNYQYLSASITTSSLLQWLLL